MPPVGTVGRGGTLSLSPKQFPNTGLTGTYVAHIPLGTSTVVDHVAISGIGSGPLNK